MSAIRTWQDAKAMECADPSKAGLAMPHLIVAIDARLRAERLRDPNGSDISAESELVAAFSLGVTLALKKPALTIQDEMNLLNFLLGVPR